MENYVPLFPSTGDVPETIVATLLIITAGLLGALTRQLLEREGLKLPSIKENTLYLGFVGEIIIGGVAGWYLGDSVVGSFSIGLTAASLVNGLIIKPLSK